MTKRILLITSLVFVACIVFAIDIYSFSRVYALVGTYFPLDDAYIHLQIARNFANGCGWSFNAGEPTAGSTAPLFTFVLALAGIWAKNPDAWLLTLRMVGIIFHAGTVCIFFLWAYKRLENILFSAACSLCIGLQGCMVWSANAGMEITFACFLIMLLLYIREVGRQTGMTIFCQGFISGLAILLRPESVIIPVLIALESVFHVHRKDEQETSTLHVDAHMNRHVLYYVAGAGIVLGGYVAVCALLSVSPLPNSFHAKAGFQGFAVLLDYLRDALFQLFRYQPVMLLCAVAGTCIVVAGWLQGRGIISLYIFPWVLIAANAVINPHLYNHGRYLIFLVPLFGALGFISIERLLKSEKKICLAVSAGRATVEIGTPFRTFGVLITVLAVLCTAASILTWKNAFLRDIRCTRDNHALLSEYLQKSLQPGDTVAVHDIGHLGFATNLRVYDVAGLVTPEVFALRKLSKDQYDRRLLERWNEQRVKMAAEFSNHYYWFPSEDLMNVRYELCGNAGCFKIWRKRDAVDGSR